MSFTPQVTFEDAGGAVPYQVALAPGQNISPYSIVADWDGTGASGTFLACLSIYSQDGKLLSRTFPSQQFSAGDTGVVTYFPFADTGPAGVSLPATLMQVEGPGSDSFEFTQTDTTDHAVLLNSGASTWFGSEVEDQGGGEWINKLLIKNTGLYLAQCVIQTPIDTLSDFTIGALCNVFAPNAGSLDPIDQDSDDPGFLLDYTDRLAAMINNVEGLYVYPTQTRYLRIDSTWGIDPSDPTTFVRVYPFRLVDFFGVGPSHPPSTGTLIARVTVARQGDVTG